MARTVLAVFIFSISSALWSSVLYVDDNLRVGVRPQPNANSIPIDVVVTGMQLQVLEKGKGYIRVRTEKGVEGWVKDIYVTDSPPAILELQVLKNKIVRLQRTIAHQQELINASETSSLVLSEQLDEFKQQATDLRLELIKIKGKYYNKRNYAWIFYFSALFILVCVGFFTGVSWYRRQTMKRLGGLRF